MADEVVSETTTPVVPDNAEAQETPLKVFTVTDEEGGRFRAEINSDQIYTASPVTGEDGNLWLFILKEPKERYAVDGKNSFALMPEAVDSVGGAKKLLEGIGTLVNAGASPEVIANAFHEQSMKVSTRRAAFIDERLSRQTT